MKIKNYAANFVILEKIKPYIFVQVLGETERGTVAVEVR